MVAESKQEKYLKLVNKRRNDLMLPKYLSLTEHITPQEYDFLLSSVVMAIKAYQLGLDENKQHALNSSKVSSN